MIPEYSKLLTLLTAVSTSEEEAREFLRMRIAYGPKMPTCKRCDHEMCVCCYGHSTWCDACFGEDEHGTVEAEAELAVLDIRPLKLTEESALYEQHDNIFVHALDTGRLFVHAKLDAKNSKSLPSVVEGYVWERYGHVTCAAENACDVDIPEGLDEALQAWWGQRVAGESMGASIETDAAGNVVRMTHASWQEILERLGLSHASTSTSGSLPRHASFAELDRDERARKGQRALHLAAEARRAARARDDDDYTTNEETLRAGAAALVMRLTPLQARRFLQLVAHAAADSPEIVEWMWRTEDVGAMITRIEALDP